MQRPVVPPALHLALGSAAEDDRQHRRRCESLCSSRRAIGQWPLFESPFCAGCMLVRPDDGGIDHHVLEIWVLPQDFEKTLPNALFRPAIEPHENAIPRAKWFRKIAPRCTRAQNPKHSIEEQPVILASPTSVAFLARYQMLDTRPLHIAEVSPNQDRLHLVCSCITLAARCEYCIWQQVLVCREVLRDRDGVVVFGVVRADLALCWPESA